MRDEWYGDSKDLVKWSVLLELEQRYNAKHILQILYYQPSKWKRIKIDKDEVELNSAVRQHFRDCSSVTEIACKSRIEVLSGPFTDNRREYQKEVLRRIQQRAKPPGVAGIVFLDPDTGLEPRSKATLKHVLGSELAEIWGALSLGDVLVLYQHKTNRRNDSDWIQDKKTQFERALKVQQGKARIGLEKSKNVDVVLFFAEKDS